MDASKDYYKILGVQQNAEQDVLKAVYYALLKKYHPDLFSGSKPDAEAKTKNINEADEILGSPEKRTAYDTLRRQSGTYQSQETESSTP
jgi:curved DNA-binding protein